MQKGALQLQEDPASAGGTEDGEAAVTSVSKDAGRLGPVPPAGV